VKRRVPRVVNLAAGRKP